MKEIECRGALLEIEKTAEMDKLETALNEAREANAAKSSFLASMSHEMRTPLNAIIGLSELTLETGRLSTDDYINLEKIKNAGMTLLNTVNNILDISKIEAGKLEFILSEYDMPSLINDAVTQSNLFRGEKPVRFVLRIDKNLPSQLYGDELRVKQIFNNLLSNAFKYTNTGTVELDVSCVREGDTVQMTARIRDTCIGIRFENIDTLFEEYAQLDMRINRRIMGTGLGLPITKKMVELMGGSIHVESEYGKGSIFAVRIPQGYVSGSVIGEEVAHNLKNFNYSEHKRQAKRSRISLPDARVLVVDDVATNLDVVRGLLKPYGMQVDCVSGSQEAIDAIRRESVHYDAVFMDHMMPGMNGVEATKIIREKIGSEYARTVPIIALTANAISGNEEMFLNNGFQAFISKPIEIAKLDKIVHQWVLNKDREKPLNKNEKAAERGSVPSRRNGTNRRAFSHGINGLNVGKGIEHFGGDEDAYLKILRSFTKNTPSLLDMIKEVSRENMADYAIIIHGIKGSGSGICADSFAGIAETLEKAAKAGDYDFVSAHNSSFLIAAWKLISEINEMLLQVSADSQKPKKDKPDRDTLNKLLEACRNYDMDGIDMFISELETYEYQSNGELVTWLSENITEANFAGIIIKLSDLDR